MIDHNIGMPEVETYTVKRVALKSFVEPGEGESSHDSVNKGLLWNLLLLFSLALGTLGYRGTPSLVRGTAKPATQPRVVFPLESRDLVGGQPLRVTIYLVDGDEQPLAGATVEAEVWTPSGDAHARRGPK